MVFIISRKPGHDKSKLNNAENLRANKVYRFGSLISGGNFELKVFPFGVRNAPIKWKFGDLEEENCRLVKLREVISIDPGVYQNNGSCILYNDPRS